LSAKQTRPFSQALNTSIDIASLTEVTVYSKALTGLEVGDVIKLRLVGSVFNNSGAVRTYTHIFTLGSLSISINDAASMANSAVNESVHEMECTIAISATNFASIYGELDRSNPGAIGSAQSITVNTVRKATNETTSDLTGSQTFSYGVLSTGAVATQTFKLRAVVLTILKSNP
jgi:hypothetical protein